MQINTYIEKKGIFISLQANLQNFLPLDSLKEEELSQVIEKDQLYIDGYFHLAHGDQNILGCQYWDSIDEVWAYFTDMVHQLICGGKDDSHFSFPGQPVSVQIRKAPGQILLTVEENCCSFSEEEFLPEFTTKGRSFFEKMKLTKSQDTAYSDELDLLNEIENTASLVRS